MDCFQPITDKFERFSEPFLKGIVQLLIHGLAHFFKFFLVTLLKLFYSKIKGAADAIQCSLIGVTEFLQLFRHAFQLRVLNLAHTFQSLGKHLVGRSQAG